MRTLIIVITVFIIIGILSFTAKPGLKISSSAFTDNSMIPVQYSCEGEEISPPLHIDGIPSDAKSIAIIVHDPDAPLQGGFTHWVVWNVGTDGNIPEDYKGADQGYNGAKQNGYKGMCPPSGVHHYHFMVYALNTKLDLDKNTDKAGLEKAMKTHILASGELVGLYEKANHKLDYNH